MSDEQQPDLKTYAIEVKVLGNQVLSVGLNTTNDSNRWVFIGAVTVCGVLITIASLGNTLIDLYHRLAG